MPRPQRPDFKVFELEPRITPTVSLVADINSEGRGSNPNQYAQVGGFVYFAATDETHGIELWRTDGTSAGTFLVKDIRPGTGSSNPAGLVNVNGVLFFRAETPNEGRELWKSDGTNSGTVLVRDISNGLNSSSNPYSLTNVNGTLLFSAGAGLDGTNRELWKSDGTSSGTTLVRDILPGALSSRPFNLVVIDSTLFFTADDGVRGRELWRSDGTFSGTTIVADIDTGTGFNYGPRYLTNGNGVLYFNARDAATGYQLWRSDGTSTGTKSVQDNTAGSPIASSPKSLVNVNDTIFFKATDNVNGLALWHSDGTSSGTSIVRDIKPGFAYAYLDYLDNLTNVNGVLYFTADDGVHGIELWRSNGTSSGTMIVHDINTSNSLDSVPRYLTNVNGVLFFSAENGATGVEIWRSDGTSAGTILVSDIRPGQSGSHPINLYSFGNTLLYDASNGTVGRELWRSDGTSSGTSLVNDIITTTENSYPVSIATVGSTVYFSARNFDRYKLWKTISGSTGATLVADVSVGSLTAVGNVLYFTDGGSIRKYDVTNTGTTLLFESDFIPAGANTHSLTNVNDTLFFVAPDSGRIGHDLWRTDGTSSGTVLVHEVTPFDKSYPISNLTNVMSALYFISNDGVNGQELWRSDGTSSGTSIVSDISPGAAGTNFGKLVEFDGALYFTANGSLWRSDGTSAGTTVVHADDITSLVAVGNQLYFQAGGADPSNQYELWKSDGTSSGTNLIRSFTGSVYDFRGNDFWNAGGTLFFHTSGTEGREMWTSDGTSSGTQIVLDINPGPASALTPNVPGSRLTILNNIGSVLYFTATDGSNDARPELWRSDGTSLGTSVIDLEIGTASEPRFLYAVGDALYFSAYRSDVGYELFVFRDGIAPVNTPPSISNIADQTTAPGGVIGPLAFTVTDEETLAVNLSVSVTSSNLAVIPQSAIIVSGSGSVRTITVNTLAGIIGISTLTVTIADEGGLTAQESFTINLTTSPPPPNTPPTISDLTDKTIVQGTTLGPVSFTIGDAESPLANLTVSVFSSNPTLVPIGNVVLGGSGANRTISVTPVPGMIGNATLTVTVSDEGSLTASDSFALTVTSPPPTMPTAPAKEFSVGRDAGETSTVILYNPDKSVRYSLTPYGSGFTGGIRTAAADFNDDGIADLVVASGPGRAGNVRIYDGVDQKVLFDFNPFGDSFTRGIVVSAGDMTNDGKAEVVITAESGGGARVRIFSPGTEGFVQLADFIALIGGDGVADTKFRGGGRSAVGDFNGDGFGDLAFAAGTGGGPRIAIFDGKTMNASGSQKIRGDFFAFEPNLRNGTYIAAGDFDGDGKAELVAGAGPGGGPRVSIFSGSALLVNQEVRLKDFFAGNVNNRGGIRVTLKNLDNDDNADLVVGAGPGGGSRTTAYLGAALLASSNPPSPPAFDFDAFSGFAGGVYVG